jgi:NADP-dependent 3-hydroxy acid dehydrogenase YdfG
MGHQVVLGARRTDRITAMLEQSSIPASAVAEAIGFAVSQPENVDVNELIVRPTAQR